MAETKVQDVKKYTVLDPHFPGGWRASLTAASNLGNRSFNRSIGCSPLHRLSGQPVLLPADKQFNITSSSLLKTETPLSQEKQQQQRQQEVSAKNTGKKARCFTAGDHVIYASGHKGKHQNVRGPAEVIDMITNSGVDKALHIKDDDGERQHVVAVKNSVK